MMKKEKIGDGRAGPRWRRTGHWRHAGMPGHRRIQKAIVPALNGSSYCAYGMVFLGRSYVKYGGIRAGSGFPLFGRGGSRCCSRRAMLHNAARW